MVRVRACLGVWSDLDMIQGVPRIPPGTMMKSELLSWGLT